MHCSSDGLHLPQQLGWLWFANAVNAMYFRPFSTLEPASRRFSYLAAIPGTYLLHLAVEVEILYPPLPAGASIPVETPRADKRTLKTPQGLGKRKPERGQEQIRQQQQQN